MAADKQNEAKVSSMDENKENSPDGGLGLENQYTGDHQGNGNLNNGNNNWQDSLFLFVAIFFFFWLLSV